MSTFATAEVPVKGSTPFYKLIKSGKCLYDEFMDELERSGNRKSEHSGILAIIDWVSNDPPGKCELPIVLFKELKGYGKLKDYEVRKNGARVYLTLYKNGYLLINGGKKQDYKRDIAYMRKLKKDFLNL